MSAPLAQRLLLVRFLSDSLAKVRKDDLLPEAEASMEPGERHAVKLGGKLAGWASMPKPTKTANVTDEHKLLAWARENYPDRIAVTDEVAVSDDLISYLAEHAPQFLHRAEHPDPQWVTDMCAGLKERGYWADHNGEKVTDVPGITAGSSTPVPRVTLEEDAAQVIAEAWTAGQIDLGGLLALPGGEA